MRLLYLSSFTTICHTRRIGNAAAILDLMNREEVKEWLRKQLETNFRESEALLALTLILLEHEGNKQAVEAL